MKKIIKINNKYYQKYSMIEMKKKGPDCFFCDIHIDFCKKIGMNRECISGFIYKICSVMTMINFYEREIK
jgi:hypothetical protein